MSVIGIRCWGNSIAWVVLDGSREDPTVVDHGHASAPNDCTRAEALHWLRREVLEVGARHEVRAAYYREVEGRARGAATVTRYEYHGVLQEAWHCARPQVEMQSRLTNQIKRDTGIRGAGVDLARELIHGTPLADLPQTQYKDAILVALCGLPAS